MNKVTYNAQTGEISIEEMPDTEIPTSIEILKEPTIEERVSTVETIQGEVIRILSEVF